MQYKNEKNCLCRGYRASSIEYRASCKALTLVEMVVAMAIMVIVFAAIVPQFRVILNSWDSKAGAAEALQNGRVLMDHLNHNLSKAVKITDVNASSEPNIHGYIQFEDNDGNNFRYDVNSTSNYVEFGRVGNLSDLAGPVSSLQFTCYDACDTLLSNPIDTNSISIRLVKVEATLTNSAALGQDKTFTASIYLRTNWNSSSAYDPNLVGWWKLDETSGTTAADSSGKGNNGTLVHMDPPTDWVTGLIGGALDLDGSNDYVDCGNGASLNITDKITLSVWVKTNDAGNGEYNYFVGKGDTSYAIQHQSSNQIEFFIYDNGAWYNTWYGYGVIDESFNGIWHHLAGTYDGSQLKLYVDGVLQDTKAHIGSINSTAYNVYIGENSGSVGSLYKGVVDDVRIYNRALTATEIAQLANVLRYRAFNEAKQGTDTTSVAISTPATNTGDLLIAAVATDGSTSLVTPADWTLINSGAYSSQVTLGAWRKFSAGASEPASHTFTWTGGNQQAYGWMMRFTGHDPNSTNVINDYNAIGGSSSTPTSPAVTTTVDNCLILRLGAFDDDNDIVIDSPNLPGHSAITMDATGVVYWGFSEANLPSGGTSLTISKPSGTVNGDLLIAAVVTDGNTSTSISVPGWTLYNRGTDSNNAETLGTWYKQASESEAANYSFSWTGSKQAYGWIMRFSGHNTTTPIFTYSGVGWTSGNGMKPNSASVASTTPVANAMIVRIGGFDNASITVDNPGLPGSGHSGHRVITMDKSGNSGSTCSGGAGYIKKPILDSNGCGTTTFSLTGIQWYRTVTLGIAPKAGVGGGGTVSGGAGYVKQSVAGGSGTSTFSIYSSNEARTLTIAIAPDPNGGGGCGGGGQILP